MSVPSKQVLTSAVWLTLTLALCTFIGPRPASANFDPTFGRTGHPILRDVTAAAIQGGRTLSGNLKAVSGGLFADDLIFELTDDDNPSTPKPRPYVETPSPPQTCPDDAAEDDDSSATPCPS